MRNPLAILTSLFDRLGRYEAAATIAGFAVNPLTCVCAHCWPMPAVTRPAIATIGIATAPWRKRLASRGT